MGFRIVGRPAEPFSALFTLSKAELDARGIVRTVVEHPHAYPCA